MAPIPRVGVAQRLELLAPRQGAELLPTRQHVERQARLEAEQHRDPPAVRLADHAPALRGQPVDEVEHVPAAAGRGDETRGHRDAEVDGDRPHVVPRGRADVGVVVVDALERAFDDAGADVAHHLGERAQLA
jgi:hypothetical protein